MELDDIHEGLHMDSWSVCRKTGFAVGSAKLGISF